MAQAIDPVCGMPVDTKTAKFTTQYQGKTIYFCAPGCKKAFEQTPPASSHMVHKDRSSRQHKAAIIPRNHQHEMNELAGLRVQSGGVSQETH